LNAEKTDKVEVSLAHLDVGKVCIVVAQD